MAEKETISVWTTIPVDSTEKFQAFLIGAIKPHNDKMVNDWLIDVYQTINREKEYLAVKAAQKAAETSDE